MACEGLSLRKLESQPCVAPYQGVGSSAKALWGVSVGPDALGHADEARRVLGKTDNCPREVHQREQRQRGAAGNGAQWVRRRGEQVTGTLSDVE